MLLEGKKILILGVASERSIASAIALFAHKNGAKVALTYQSERLKAQVEDLAALCEADFIYPCDVKSDSEVSELSKYVSERWGSLDGLVHSLAFAPQEALSGDYVDSIAKKAFLDAHEISSFSLGQLCLALKEPLKKANGKVITMSFIGAERAFPSYNVMGLAKASLEANVRYLAHSLGPFGINVNAISAGPIKTLAAVGIKGFRQMLKAHAGISALKRNVSAKEVAQVATFLLSDLSSGITGEVIHVDAGYRSAGILPESVV